MDRFRTVTHHYSPYMREYRSVRDPRQFGSTSIDGFAEPYYRVGVQYSNGRMTYGPAFFMKANNYPSLVARDGTPDVGYTTFWCVDTNQALEDATVNVAYLWAFPPRDIFGRPMAPMKLWPVLYPPPVYDVPPTPCRHPLGDMTTRPNYFGGDGVARGWQPTATRNAANPAVGTMDLDETEDQRCPPPANFMPFQ